tara:strand:+ start:1034 stop:2728 length:1695 start_codon:yes stop_codon:yes gene_type:complete
MKRKLRILWCGEASFLNTGYSVYAKEVLGRLHKTGKYEIAELGCYGSTQDPLCKKVPWSFYSNLPYGKEEDASYKSAPQNQFGEWRFNEVCLHFKPDVVIDIRDWWMMEFEARSEFRRFFHWLIMPTIDSAPQNEQYLNTYSEADGVFTYSDFGRDVLKESMGESINFIECAPPGADFNALTPASNKSEHRQSFGFMDNIKIVGTVMRNQRRKLYPNLMKSFREMLDENPNMANNTFLYMHTSYPDVGWNLPYFIKKYNIGNKVLMTYKCQNCRSFFPSFYQDCKTCCPKCGELSAVFPGTTFGVSTEELGQIINFFDVYVQYSICEGFGMPQVEAAACGVPVITVDYSAMSSVGKKIRADFVEPQTFFWDSPTQSERAIPNDQQLKERMKKILNLPSGVRTKKGMDSRALAQKHYSWDKTAIIWEKSLDGIEPKDMNETWLSESQILEPQEKFPENISNSDFIDWCVANVLGEPLNQYVLMGMLKDLNYGKSTACEGALYYNADSYVSQAVHTPFTREDAFGKLKQIRERKNYWEQQRDAVNNGYWEQTPPSCIRNHKPGETS